MTDYLATLYWWDEGERTPGGEYPISAGDDAGALAVAMRDLEEQVALADQCEITTREGRVVWRNEWPPAIRGGRVSLADDWKVLSRGPLIDLSDPFREAAADRKACWGLYPLEQLLIEAAVVLPGCDWSFEREAGEVGCAWIDGQMVGLVHDRLPIGLFSRAYEAEVSAMHGVKEIRLVFFDTPDERQFRIDPVVAREILGWEITVCGPVTFSVMDLWYVLKRGQIVG